MKKVTGFILMLAIVVLSAVPASAQTEKREHKVYQLKHQNAKDIINLLPGGSAGAINAKFNTIAIAAVPDVHEIVASILEKYDVPDSPEKTIEFQFFLVKADISDNAAQLQETINAIKTQIERLNSILSLTTDREERSKMNQEVEALETVISVQSSKLSALKTGLKEELPEKVRIVLNEIAGLTRYKNFELIDAPFLRGVDGSGATISGRGQDGYRVTMEGMKISEGVDKRKINIGKFSSTFTVMSIPIHMLADRIHGITYVNVGISSTLELTEGEMTVIGTSQGLQAGANSEPYSIIVMVTAKIL